MRLRQKDLSGIFEAIESFGPKSAQLFLFGSRVDDAAKGGDIDLLLVVQHQKDHAQLLTEKTKILTAIQRKIGERRIDLTIVLKGESNPFLQSIEGTKILLREWA